MPDSAPAEPAEPAGAPRRRNWRAALAVYRDRRLVVILLMGFASGLPLPLTLATLSYWLARVGVDKTAIGLFALVGLPYGLKFVWAPVLDHVRAPVLGHLFGRRRGWALLTQAALILSILVLGASDPLVAPWVTAAAALAVAFCSASQDIAIDAYRIEILEDFEQGAGAAATQAGYRIGLLVAGAGAIALSDFAGWFAVFAVLAVFVLVGTAAVLMAPEPARPSVRPAESQLDWLRTTVVAPFADFLRRPGWVAILAFILLYKFGDAIGGVMSNPFYVELGFTGVEIASITKVFGLLATFAGIVAGGVLVARYGLFPALAIGGVLQAATNLLYAAQAAVGHDIVFLAGTIGADNFTGGLGSAAFVAYLSSLCNRAFTGTQFALLTSFMAVGRTVLSAGGGWLADRMDWVAFFSLTAALAVPGLLLLFWLMRLQAARPAGTARP
jgi:MFS transporter, PAT family, beta-lactamase induction signal transducer AmpG